MTAARNQIPEWAGATLEPHSGQSGYTKSFPQAAPKRKGAPAERLYYLHSMISLARRLREFLELPLYEKINQLTVSYFLAKTHFFYRHLFGSVGSHCMIRKPTSLYNARFIHLGNRVSVGSGVRLDAIVDKPSRVPDLRIGNNVNM